MPNATPNDTPIHEIFPPDVTVEDKRQEIYLALKFLAVRSIQIDDLDTARHCMNAAQIVYEMEPEGADAQWKGA